MELRGEALEKEVNSWSRLELIEWLCWNDRNGVYRDDLSLQEFDNILGKEEAIETQVNRNIFATIESRGWVHDFQN